MDLADEIAYAAHDLEDALSRNMVTIEDIEYEFQISDEFRGAREQFREIVTQSRNTAFQANLLKTSEEFAIIFRKELTSNIVNRLVADISVVTNLNGFQELGFGKLNALSEGLKKLLFKVIMRKRNILTYEFRGNKIIRDLYDFYNEGENYKFLPPELKFTLPQPDSCIFKISKNEQWLTIFRYDGYICSQGMGNSLSEVTLSITRGAYFPVMVIAPLFCFGDRLFLNILEMR